MKNVTKFIYTLKYLKINQIYYRFYRLFSKVSFVERRLELSNLITGWSCFPVLESSYRGNGRFEFLNSSSLVTCWNNSNISKLWLYNLHYFDDLNQINWQDRTEIHANLINTWIDQNPKMVGNGWEPYPLSLRIVNWIKFFIRNDDIPSKWNQNLAQQAFALEQSLEYHLLGNHLFANAKALVFAGSYFEGDDASRWLKKGLAILDKEIPEQILDDGANFELSPMYHQTILADLLDLVNLSSAYSSQELGSRVADWTLIASKMLGWMDAMNHPDGEISFFNDAAIGIAPKASRLHEYANLLGVKATIIEPTKQTQQLRAIYLQDSGYTVIESTNCKALLDTARIGPDYIPGHAHADSLSFELSLFGQRVFVNSGTGEYGISEERLRQRKTSAHNSVEVDGEDSSEVWSGFRVARRAYPQDYKLEQQADNTLLVECSHNGYKRLKGKVIHSRQWKFTPNTIEIKDTLTGKYNHALSHLHLHPEVELQQESTTQVRLSLSSGHHIHLISSSPISIIDATWHPEFGLCIPNKKLVLDVIDGDSQFYIKF